MGKWRGWGHGQCEWVSGLGGMYLEHGHVEGGQDVSHSGWMATWCLTMSKSRHQVFLFRLTAKHFSLGPLLDITWPGECMWATLCQKNYCPTHLCFAVTAVSTASESHPLLIYTVLSFCCPPIITHTCASLPCFVAAMTSHHPWPPCLCTCIMTPTMHLLHHPCIHEDCPTDGNT